MRQNDVHVLHFIGHGDYDDRIQDGVLYFQDQLRAQHRGHARPSSAPTCATTTRCGWSCSTPASPARVDSTDPFSGMAQGLVQQDCTAVVAMQFPICDGAATAFTGEFYGALADGFPVDQAVTSARKALLAEFAAEWATPVLFLRAPDGRVFDHIVAQPAVTAVPTPAPQVEAEDEERAREALATDAETTETTRKTAEEVLLEPAPTPQGVQPEELKPVALAPVALTPLALTRRLSRRQREPTKPPPRPARCAGSPRLRRRPRPPGRRRAQRPRRRRR